MINSRKIEDLDTEVRDVCHTHLALCHHRGIELLVTSTFRDAESQAQMYAVGRTIFPQGPKTKRITNAQPWESWHQYRCAYDVVPLVMGKPDWVSRNKAGELTPIWEVVVAMGKQAGAEAAADWTSFREDAHFQVRPKVHGLHIAIHDAKVRFQDSGTIFTDV